MTVPLGDRTTPADLASHRFLMTFALVVGVLLAGLAGVNVLVDPRSDFDTRWLPPLAIRHRAERVARLSAPLDPPPRVLVLGSSRVWKIEPGFLEETLGLPAFVAGVDDAGAEDLLALARFALLDRKLPIELILLQLDVPAFHSDRPASAQLVRSAALRAYLPGDIPWSDFAAPYLDTLTHGELLESVRTVQALRTMAWKPVPDVVILPRGDIRYQHREARIRQGTFDLPAHIRETLGTFLEIYEGFEALSPRRLRYLEELVALAQARGVELLAYLAPVHPEYARVLAQRTRYRHLLSQLRAAATLRLTGPMTRFVDASDLATFGGDPALYYDGIHPREENNRRMLRVLFAERMGDRALQ